MSKEREEKVKALIRVCKSILCYLPRAYSSPGPHGRLLKAMAELEEAE
jgi:hypothetical protein